MRKDPTEFRKRFAKWKETGEYELPRFEDGEENYTFAGYNYDYKNKTSNGYLLSIKDGRAYLNGKIAGAGYVWYDKNNGNLYKTIGSGKFKLVSTQEGPIYKTLSQKNNDAHYLYKSDKNAIDHLKSEVDPDELTGADKLFLYRSDFVNNRLNTEEKYAIPQHLPGVKRRTLSTGQYKGVRVYDNTLDSIRTNSLKNGVSFVEGLGLAAETSLGKDVHMFVNESKKDYNLAANRPYYNSTQNGRYALFPTDIVNNHNYYVGNNATGTINTLIRNGIIPGIPSFGGQLREPFPIIGATAYDDYGNPIFTKLSDLQKKIIASEAEKVLKRKETSSSNPWENTFDFYRNYNYGMGTGYLSTVKQRGRSILNTPELQEYLKYAE